MKIYTNINLIKFGFLVFLNLPSLAYACKSIDSKFQSVGELISENTQSINGNPNSLVILIGPPVYENDAAAGIHPKMLSLKVDAGSSQLNVSHVLGNGELGRTITWEVVCDEGKWLIDKKDDAFTEGGYLKYSSKIWLSITPDNDLQVEQHLSRVSGLIFHDYYYYESKARFKSSRE